MSWTFFFGTSNPPKKIIHQNPKKIWRKIQGESLHHHHPVAACHLRNHGRWNNSLILKLCSWPTSDARKVSPSHPARNRWEIAPEKHRVKFPREIILEPLIFRGKLAVSFKGRFLHLSILKHCFWSLWRSFWIFLGIATLICLSRMCFE